MSKKNIQKSIPQEPIVSSLNQTKNKATINLIPNIGLAVATFFFLFILQKQVVGYNWVWQTLIKENLKFQARNKRLTDQVKAESKMGYDITFMSYLNEKTPENAVILFPESDVILKDSTGEEPKFRTTGGGLYTALWVQYFAFPRKIVFANEKGKNPNYNKITHVAVVNYWGYDFLPYKVANKQRLGVLPIKASEAEKK